MREVQHDIAARHILLGRGLRIRRDLLDRAALDCVVLCRELLAVKRMRVLEDDVSRQLAVAIALGDDRHLLNALDARHGSYLRRLSGLCIESPVKDRAGSNASQ